MDTQKEPAEEVKREPDEPKVKGEAVKPESAVPEPVKQEAVKPQAIEPRQPQPPVAVDPQYQPQPASTSPEKTDAPKIITVDAATSTSTVTEKPMPNEGESGTSI